MSRRWRVRSGLVTVAVGTDRVILDPETGTYFSLNRVAARAWELLAEPCTAEAIAQQLLVEFEAPLERILHDVEELTSTLVDRGLLDVLPND